MSTLTANGVHAAPRPPAEADGLFWRLSVDQYHAMIREGILTDDDPVELLEGWLITKMPKYRKHSLSTHLLRKQLEKLFPENCGWYVDSQEPITLSDSEPEPDNAVVRGKPRDYTDRHPGPADLGMVVETSESSLAHDQGWKKRIYAKDRVPVYWIVNVPDRRIEVYTEPSGPAANPDFAKRQDFGSGDEVPVIVDGKEWGRIAVNEVLP